MAKNRTLATAIALWAAASLLEATVTATQEGVPFAFALLGAGANLGILALLAIPLWRLCERLTRARRPPIVTLLWHLAALIVVVAVWQSAYLGLAYLAGGPQAIAFLRTGGVWYLAGVVLVYGLVLAAILQVQTSRRLQRQQERAAELQLLRREAEVRALRAQLRPHFLFNVLNSIYALLETRPEQAKRMVELVARLMRQTLEVADVEHVPLSWELDSVRTYLAIESVRLGPRLRTRIEVDAACEKALVPPLLLQPLVENAVKHGVAPHRRPGTITVAAASTVNSMNATSGARLRLTVSDSGPGPAPDTASDPAQTERGHGLDITRRCLHAMYGSAGSLRLLSAAAGTGYAVQVEIPYRTEAPTADEGDDG